MLDKGLDRILMGFFGITGIVILIFAGTQAMPLSDKLMTILFGVGGLGWALVRVLSWKFRHAETV
jgi:hypothetical protein